VQLSEHRLADADVSTGQASWWLFAQIWDSMPGYSDCSFADSLWSAMDEAICLPECDVYSYKSDGEDDPFGTSRFTYVTSELCSMLQHPCASAGLHS
jgi:Maf1 regulator